MDDKTEKRIVNTIKSVMEVDITKLPPDKQINTIHDWDSFNNLMLVSKFQEEYGIEFTANDIENIHTIQDLLDFLESKL